MTPTVFKQNDATVFRNQADGYLYLSFLGNTQMLNIIHGNMFKIYDKNFNGKLISKTPELQYVEIKTTDGSRTFEFIGISRAVSVGGGGGGLNQTQIINLINQFGGFNVESGEFIRTATAPSGLQVVPTTRQAKMIFFFAQDNGSGHTGSEGKSNVLINDAIAIGALGVDVPNLVGSVAISVWQNTGIDGQDGQLIAMNPTSYTLSWIKTGNGSVDDFTVKWIAITN